MIDTKTLCFFLFVEVINSGTHKKEYMCLSRYASKGVSATATPELVRDWLAGGKAREDLLIKWVRFL